MQTSDLQARDICSIIIAVCSFPFANGENSRNLGHNFLTYRLFI